MGTKFDFDAAIAEANADEFVFTWKGEERRLPSLNSLPPEQVVLAFSGEGGLADQLQLIGEVFGDGWDEVYKTLPSSAVNGLLTAWIEHAGLQPGESAASSS